jgi:hypothetical protein
MLPCGMPKRHVSGHFAFRILAKSKIGALLVPFFGQSQKVHSPRFATSKHRPSHSKDHSYGGMRLVPGAFYSRVASCMAGPM